MKRITILIIIVFFLIIAITATVIYRKSDFVRDISMVPRAIVQYSEIAVRSGIEKYKANQRPDIVKVSKEGEGWIVHVNKKAVKEIQKGAIVRLHIGYCSWDGQLKDFTVTKDGHGHVLFSPEWHPPYTRNRVIVGLIKNNKYLCSVRAW